MQRPQEVEFEGLTINAASLLRPQRRSVGAIDRDWHRTTFSVPDAHSSPKRVDDWLEANCKAGWTSFHYTNPQSKDYSQVMVVRFEDRNDAMFFKLRDGHRAWEN